MTFDILTIFPDIFTPYFSESIMKRAQGKKLVKIKAHNLRDYTTDRHGTVDDAPYGGGAGMVMKVEPIYRALRALKSKTKGKKSKIILLSPKGRQFDQKMAEKLSELAHIILVCGRYEGVDERVNKFIDEKISIGPYVLTGGELPAMIMMDTITRLIPGVIKKESLEEETFSIPKGENKLEIENCLPAIRLRRSRLQAGKLEIFHQYPQYTRPEIFEYKNKPGRTKRLGVPKVLLAGDHKKIEEWRKAHSKLISK